MAVATTVRKRSTAGRLRSRVVDVAFDSAYPTGGEPFTASDCELSSLDTVVFVYLTVAGAYSSEQARWDPVNNKLIIGTWAGVEIGATNRATTVVRLMVHGT